MSKIPTLKAVLAALLSSISLLSVADSSSGNWRWYYSSFSSPALDSSLFLRNGTAQVTMNKKNIKIIFHESALPEMNPSFNGTVYENKINGTFDKFFPSGSESLSGQLEKKTFGNCHFEEIVLRSGIPDSSILVLSKIYGNCQ